MRHVIVLTVFSLSLNGCGKVQDAVDSVIPGDGGGSTRKAGVKDPAFTRYVELYEDAYDRDISNQTILLEDKLTGWPGVSVNTLGFCVQGGNEIHILRSAWDKVSDLTKQMILFHELGHCDMGQGHRAGQQKDYCPTSIMAANITTDDCYSRNYSSYLKELSDNIRK